jgi:Brp/Blh family beta-carotene 15,15'-monooxygenase
MSVAQKQVFSNTRGFSSLAVLFVITLSLIFSRLIDSAGMTWQVILALFALAIGIPHGALDHLVTLPKTTVLKMTLFISIYVAIAIIAVWVILKWNVAGFIFVVAMSALHFGIGDTAFISELEHASHQEPATRLAQSLYALSAGALPVLIPLTNGESTSALSAVNPDLVNWHGGHASAILNIVTAFSLLTISILFILRRRRDALDLSILFALAIFTPPLVAFAAYFGLWHAMRHTARLTLNLNSSQTSIAEGQAGRAFMQAVIPGLPALVGTFIVSLVIGMTTPGKLSDEFLWLSLVVVWALTVPHMMVTAKLDKAALR